MRLPRLFGLALAAVLLLAAVQPTWAHERFRFVGNVEKVESVKDLQFVWVKFKEEGEDVTVRIWIAPGSVLTRDGKNVAWSEVKPDLSVVVDALGDGYDDLEVLEMKIVPPLAR